MWQILNSVKLALTDFKVKHQPGRKLWPKYRPLRSLNSCEGLRRGISSSVAYSQLMDAMVKSTGMWMAAMPSNELTAGFKTFQDRAVRFAKQNAEAGFAVASELTNAKNI
jgi:hypothetical protein